MAEQRDGSPRVEEANLDVDEELQRMQAELAKFEDEKSLVGVACCWIGCHLGGSVGSRPALIQTTS